MSNSEDGKTGGRWTQEEHESFLIGLAKYGREWKKIQSLIATRTPAQIRSHAQKHFLKMNRDDQDKANNAASSHKRKQDMMNVLNAFESTLTFLKMKKERLAEESNNSNCHTNNPYDDYSQREDELIAAEVLTRMSFECH